MATWGGTTIGVLHRERYFPAHVPPDIVKFKVCGDPADRTAFNEIAHQPGGRPRYRVTFRAQVTALSTYNSLLADRIAGTSRTWTGPNSDTLLSVIEDLGPPEYWMSTLVRFQMTLLEVSA